MSQLAVDDSVAPTFELLRHPPRRVGAGDRPRIRATAEVTLFGELVPLEPPRRLGHHHDADHVFGEIPPVGNLRALVIRHRVLGLNLGRACGRKAERGPLQALAA